MEALFNLKGENVSLFYPYTSNSDAASLMQAIKQHFLAKDINIKYAVCEVRWIQH